MKVLGFGYYVVDFLMFFSPVGREMEEIATFLPCYFAQFSCWM